MKVHQCRENGAHVYSAATPVLYSVLIYRTPALSLRFFGGMTYKKASLSEQEELERRVSHGLEDQIENRKCFSAGDGQLLQPIEGVSYLFAGAVHYHLLGRCMRQRDVPAKQRKRPPRGRRAEAHSGGGELLGEVNGVVINTDI